MDANIINHHNSHQNHAQIKHKTLITNTYFKVMEVTEVSELTATAMSICPFCPIISSSTTIIIISHRVLQSSTKFESTGAGDRDVDSTKGGGGRSSIGIFCSASIHALWASSGKVIFIWHSISKYWRQYSFCW